MWQKEKQKYKDFLNMSGTSFGTKWMKRLSQVRHTNEFIRVKLEENYFLKEKQYVKYICL